ncbi:hypothetical protein OsJ_16525 [Oryza sativa Japonica Group]|uniref:Uncharacterized protein n=1 Tax=Oryza sativa subsp. japonica TaxID=39947 RepID=B9FD58_ORYSJ|nr:hypothetical protein OsJ_16525 [Oryza sativa Japonica Group]
MKITVHSSKAVKPAYGPGEFPTTTGDVVPLKVFDKANFDTYISVIYAYRPPAPANAALEAGLAKALIEYREWAGRLGVDGDGNRAILLNDGGARFVEATADVTLDSVMPLKPDGGSQATRGAAFHPVPVHDRVSFFAPRDTPKVEFEHRGVEFKPYDDDEDVHASGGGGDDDEARGLDGRESTSVCIAVDGRARMSPPVPDGYTGNVVLWARPTATAGELVTRPLKHAVELINREVIRINDGYFKSFIDFANSGAVEEERLVASADAAEMVLSPNIEVDSWLRIPFYDLDFGGGRPFFFMPSYLPVEGLLILLPSFFGDGSVDAYVPLFSRDMDVFKNCCYSFDKDQTTSLA